MGTSFKITQFWAARYAWSKEVGESHRISSLADDEGLVVFEYVSVLWSYELWNVLGLWGLSQKGLFMHEQKVVMEM